MKEYIITVTAAAVVAACADILAPTEHRGYIRVAIGFLLLSVLIAPVASFKKVQIFAPDSGYEINAEPLSDRVAEELCKNVEGDIEARILEEFDLEAEARAEIDIDAEHNIRGVHAIEIRAWYEPEGLAARLREVYGCERIKFKFQ